MTEYIYRVTRIRRFPSYWCPARSVEVCTLRSVKAKLKSMAQVKANFEENKERYNLTEPAEEFIKIERAPIGTWEEITEEEING